MKKEYDSPPSKLEGQLGDVVFQKDRPSSPAVHTPTIVEEDDGGVSERILGFLIKFPDILL